MPSSSCGVSSTSARTHVAGAPVASVRRCGQLQHPRAEVDADDLVGALVPERQRVAAAGALEVDRPAAAAVEVADELDLDAEQVRAARTDQRDRLVEPALVALGGLVPGRPVGGVHRRRRRRARPRSAGRISSASSAIRRSVASGGALMPHALQDDDRDDPTARLGLVLGEARVELGVLVVQAPALICDRRPCACAS